MLIIAPTAGFGNRIRTICGGIMLSYMTNRKCYIMWEKEEIANNDHKSVANAKSTDLSQYFDMKHCTILSDMNICVDVCYSEWLPGEFWHSRQSNCQRKLLCNKIVRYQSTLDIINDKSEVILLETSYILKPEQTLKGVWNKSLSSIYKNCFTVNEKYQNYANEEKYDIGISIRRGEFLGLYPEANNSSEDIIRWINKSFTNKNVVIFSDDHEFRDKVREETNHKADPIINDILWEKGFMEFLALSNCGKIYGTAMSSFAEEAALFGDKPYETILSQIKLLKNDDDDMDNILKENSMELYQLGIKCNSDNITHHGLHRYYERYVKHLKDIDNVGMIEIGTDHGKSLSMWLEYFPKIFAYGVNLNFSLIGDRYHVLNAQQNDLDKLKKLEDIISTSHRKILFICDDGCHFPEHIFVGFNYLFKNVLENGGVYIIQGTETSYWKHGQLYGNEFNYGYLSQLSVVEVFKSIVDTINKEYLNDDDVEEQKSYTSLINENAIDMISTVTFCHNCIIIVKKEQYEYKYYNRKYRFVQFIQ
jgi:hypothetical protein